MRLLRYLSSLLCYLLLLNPMAYAVQAPDNASINIYQDAFIEILDSKPATHLQLSAHGKNTDAINKILAETYQKNQLQPFWLDNGKPGVRASEIIAVLDDAPSHGLNSSSYFVDKIHQYWNSAGTRELAALDMLITIGMVRYMADQREGRMEPNKVDPELFAEARSTVVDWPALLAQSLSAPDMTKFLAQQAPPYRQYAALRKALANYKQLAAQGKWPTVPEGPTLKVGMTDPRVADLRGRLAATDVLVVNNDSPVFDADLEAAVKRFQTLHALDVDGAVGKKTVATLNISLADRVKQIQINMERYRWLKRIEEDERVVVVNIASFEAKGGTPPKFNVSTPVIVGKKFHETPVFSSEITYVVINPYWNLPTSIAKKETLPKLRKDPQYLAKHNMTMFSDWGPDATKVDATKIDWHNVSPGQMAKYHIRQEPGPENALGRIKIVFPNQHSVYLHDTPQHGLFRESTRAFSHGCIRMDKPVDMASWVLGGEKTGWSVEKINEFIESHERKVVVLKEPIPVYLLYRTAYINEEENQIYFYHDIYGRDDILAKALEQ